MTLGYSNQLSYGEIAEIEKNNEEMIKRVVNNTNRNLVETLYNNLPEAMEYDKAYHITVRYLDGMNVVARIDEIPIRTETLIVPTTNTVYTPHGKLTLKERIKILIRGEL